MMPALLYFALIGATFSAPISYPTFKEVKNRLHALAAAHPDLVEVYSAQARYGTPYPSPENPNVCDDIACDHWYISITNRTLGGSSWASASPALVDRPQFFASGNLHGDEWVGPVTLLELAELIVAGATGRGASFNPWLARLVNTRVIVLLPVSNPWGYTRRVREDFNGRDPNRDFSYDREDDMCLSTTIARAINADFRAHVYQVSVTFHGGMEEVSWEWGSKHHENEAGARCPDDIASELLGDAMRDIAGGLVPEGGGSKHYYPAGRIDPDVYWVNGGMEDWAYGGSFYVSTHTAFCAHSLTRPPPPPPLLLPHSTHHLSSVVVFKAQ